MFLHSKQFCEGFTEDCVQPNALDITCDKIESINLDDYLIIDEKTSHREKKDFPATDQGPDGEWFYLQPGNAYEFVSKTSCNIPAGVVGWLISRSSLNRNGVFILSGLYDSGFRGSVGGTIYVGGRTAIRKGARIAQLVTARGESGDLYAGQYQDQFKGAVTG